jgi:hypothetical protein
MMRSACLAFMCAAGVFGGEGAIVWKRPGVGGRGRPPLLQRRVFCNHCPSGGSVVQEGFRP